MARSAPGGARNATEFDEAHAFIAAVRGKGLADGVATDLVHRAMVGEYDAIVTGQSVGAFLDRAIALENSYPVHYPGRLI